MDKRQRISWGVSFGSVALVAGMVSYLGLTGGGKTNNQTITNQHTDSFGQQLQNGGFSQGNSGNDPSSQFGSDDGSSNSNDGNSFFGSGGDDNSQSVFGDNNGGSNSQGFFGNNNGSSNGGGGFGHHHGFDTTTGGS